MLCNGNFSEYCGGGDHLDVYDFNNLVSVSSTSSVLTSNIPSSSLESSPIQLLTTLSSSSTATSFLSLTTKVEISSSAATVPTAPSTPAILGSYNYLGCYTEATNARALAGASYPNDDMTLDMCEASCVGWTYFGTEYGRECEYLVAAKLCLVTDTMNKAIAATPYQLVPLLLLLRTAVWFVEAIRLNYVEPAIGFRYMSSMGHQ